MVTAIDIVEYINTTVINCNFSQNSGTNNGGAINLIIGSGLIIKQATFKNNNNYYGSLGGAISTIKNATAVIEDSVFIGNRGLLYILFPTQTS